MLYHHNSQSWEEAGAVPIEGKKPIEYATAAVRIASLIAQLPGDDPVVASAPFIEYHGIHRLGLAGDIEGALMEPVVITMNAQPEGVIFASLTFENKDMEMGRPLVGYNGEQAVSYCGDENSHERGVIGISGSLFPEGYGMMSLSKSNSSRIINDIDPTGVAVFMSVCLGVIYRRRKKLAAESVLLTP